MVTDQDHFGKTFLQNNKQAVATLLLMGAIILIPGTWQLPLLDRDEPRFAQATVEMMDRSDWIRPTFNGQNRFDKPILTYWLMRAGYALFGVSEMGARWHSIVATCLIALTLYAIGGRWFSRRVGFWAAAGFLTCFQIILNGRSCVADMPMVLAVTIAQFALFELVTAAPESRHIRWALLFYGAMGVGFLAKGPIALLVPFLTLVLYRFALWRQPLPWRRFRPILGFAVLLLIVGSWGIPALIETQGRFWDVGINQNVVRRGVEVFNGRFYSPIFYLGTSIVSLFPWIVFAGQGCLMLRSRWQAKNAFLLSWIVSLFLIFTFYATQLPHYVMPAFPAIFMVLAQALTMPPNPSRGARWWSRFITVGASVWTFVLVSFFCLSLIERAPASILVIEAGVLCIHGGFMLVLFSDRLPKHFLWMVCGMLAIGQLLFGYGLRPLHPAAMMSTALKQMPPNSQFFGFGFHEGSLVFYSNRQWMFSRSEPAIRAFLAGPGPRLAVLLETQVNVDRIIKSKILEYAGRRNKPKMVDHRPFIKTLDLTDYDTRRFSGLNLGNFSWVTLTIAKRNIPSS
jgi:4-amino-4-deoxy-L-arabinose transferase-like glycosyltransferase